MYMYKSLNSSKEYKSHTTHTATHDVDFKNMEDTRSAMDTATNMTWTSRIHDEVPRTLPQT